MPAPIRVVLAGWAEDDWRLHRQLEWVAHVRRRPEASAWPRTHFDLPEEAYPALAAEWSRLGLGRSREAAVEALTGRGAVPITPG